MKETKTLSLKIEDLKSIIRSLLIATIAIVLAMTMVPIQALAANTETINREPDVTSSINDQMESSKNDSTSIEPIIASKSVFDTSSPLAASPLSSPWESEPNDKESEANIISIGATYTGRFGSNGSSDYDYYRFYIPSTSKVTIDFTGEKGYDGAFIAGLYLYSNQIDYSASWSTYRKTPGATPTRTSNLFLPKGTYFLRVYADNGDKSWGQTYNFRITNAASNAIESETNGTESDADPISLGKYYTGSTYIPGRGSDYDYYRFYIPSTSKVTIDFTGEKGYDGAFIAGLYLYSNQIDYSASWSTYRKTPGAAPTRTSNLFLPKGTYFLRVYAESDDSSWGQTYTLRITNAQSSAIESETNGTESDADPISLGKYYTGSTYIPGRGSDYDYYRFYIPQAGKVTIDFLGTTGTDGAYIASLYLYSNQIDYSASWNVYRTVSGAGTTALINAGARTTNLFLPQGIYFLRSYAESDDSSWGQTYTLRVTNAPSSAIETEANGTESDADPISLGKYYTGSTYIPGRGSDYDYYRFYIPQAGKVTIDFLGTTGTDGAYIASLYLYSNQIDYSASWNVYRTVSGAGTTALINAGARTTNLFLPQGTYFLRSYAEDDDKSWGQTYSLRVAHDAGKYEVENNNAQNANNPLSLATTYAASLYRPGWSDDYDYYRFYVPQPSWMSIDFRFPASSAANTQADVYLYNAAGYSLEWSIKGVASNAKMSSLMQSGSKKILKLQHGIYYMRVYGDDDYISWGKEYKFIVATHNITHIDTPQKTVNLAKGRSMTLPVMSYSGNNPLSTYLTWSSTDTYVASVDQNGKVTARNPGKAMIIAKAKNGRILNVTVKVVKKSVALKSAVISGPSVMTVGSLKKLTIRLNPTTATGQNITFKSSNKTGLTVDKAGFVKALKAGTYTVTIKIGTKTYTKNITIR